jgi:hypothetical protein
MSKKLYTLITIIILPALFYSCTPDLPDISPYSTETQPAEVKSTSEFELEPSIAISLIITSDFGKNTVFEQTITIKEGTTAMEALTGAVQVETKYDGGFVSAINSTGSEYEKTPGKKKDWFFYMNGIASNIGAGSYTLRDGDVEHWDYRNWEYNQFVLAVIGAFPQPFTGGFNGNEESTTIVYETEFQAYAEDLAEKLGEKEPTSITSVEYGTITDTKQKENNLIIIAGKDNALITELNSSHKKLGFFVYFNGDTLVALDDAGNVAYEYKESYGLIQATQNPWNPRGTGVCENVVWIISGTDAEGILAAADVLYNTPDEIHNACACIINNGEVMKIP